MAATSSPAIYWVREPFRGHNPVPSVLLPGGETRTWLEEGDEVVMTARAEREGWRGIGFGECSGRICALRG